MGNIVQHRGMRSRTQAPGRIGTINESVLFSEFTDGGGAAGTYVMKSKIPVNARVLGCVIIPEIGFTGDTSAAITVGDGSDVDRYNTGTPSVYTTATERTTIAAGLVSGVQLHVAEIFPTITITSGSDWGLVTAGRVYVEIHFIEAGG
jgi:hypothetical protein